jgi:hypothetical protein
MAPQSFISAEKSFIKRQMRLSAPVCVLMHIIPCFGDGYATFLGVSVTEDSRV